MRQSPDGSTFCAFRSASIACSGFKPGTRLLGWLSVEFEEITTLKGKETRRSYKIEGYVKPVIQAAATQR